VFGPLASFVLQPGGSMGVVALLTRGATLIEAVRLQNPNDEGSRLSTQIEAALGGRRCIGWTWQSDPLSEFVTATRSERYALGGSPSREIKPCASVVRPRSHTV
jgi:hypothetical protein